MKRFSRIISPPCCRRQNSGRPSLLPLRALYCKSAQVVNNNGLAVWSGRGGWLSAYHSNPQVTLSLTAQVVSVGSPRKTHQLNLCIYFVYWCLVQVCWQLLYSYLGIARKIFWRLNMYFSAKPWYDLFIGKITLTFSRWRPFKILKDQYVLNDLLFFKPNYTDRNLVKHCIVLMSLIFVYSYTVVTKQRSIKEL